MPTATQTTDEAPLTLFHETAHGRIFLGDSLRMFRDEIQPGTAGPKGLLPDLRDDRTGLVISGQHFGKKWKHIVRNAQVFLRRKGAIQLIGKEWHVNLS